MPKNLVTQDLKMKVAVTMKKNCIPSQTCC